MLNTSTSTNNAFHYYTNKNNNNSSETIVPTTPFVTNSITNACENNDEEQQKTVESSSIDLYNDDADDVLANVVKNLNVYDLISHQDITTDDDEEEEEEVDYFSRSHNVDNNQLNNKEQDDGDNGDEDDDDLTVKSWNNHSEDEVTRKKSSDFGNSADFTSLLVSPADLNGKDEKKSNGCDAGSNSTAVPFNTTSSAMFNSFLNHTAHGPNSAPKKITKTLKAINTLAFVGHNVNKINSVDSPGSSSSTTASSIDSMCSGLNTPSPIKRLKSSLKVSGLCKGQKCKRSNSTLSVGSSAKSVRFSNDLIHVKRFDSNSEPISISSEASPQLVSIDDTEEDEEDEEGQGVGQSRDGFWFGTSLSKMNSLPLFSLDDGDDYDYDCGFGNGVNHDTDRRSGHLLFKNNYSNGSVGSVKPSFSLFGDDEEEEGLEGYNGNDSAYTFTSNSLFLNKASHKYNSKNFTNEHKKMGCFGIDINNDFKDEYGYYNDDYYDDYSNDTSDLEREVVNKFHKLNTTSHGGSARSKKGYNNTKSGAKHISTAKDVLIGNDLSSISVTDWHMTLNNIHPFISTVTESPEHDILNYLNGINIKLHSISCNPSNGKLTGYIFVTNLNFEKFIEIKYTCNGWVDMHYVVAHYHKTLSPQIDEFKFEIDLSKLRFFLLGKRILSNAGSNTNNMSRFVMELCCRYDVSGQTYYDNNDYKNYKFTLSAKLGVDAANKDKFSRDMFPLRRTVSLNALPSRRKYSEANSKNPTDGDEKGEKKGDKKDGVLRTFTDDTDYFNDSPLKNLYHHPTSMNMPTSSGGNVKSATVNNNNNNDNNSSNNNNNNFVTGDFKMKNYVLTNGRYKIENNIGNVDNHAYNNIDTIISSDADSANNDKTPSYSSVSDDTSRSTDTGSSSSSANDDSLSAINRSAVVINRIDSGSSLESSLQFNGGSANNSFDNLKCLSNSSLQKLLMLSSSSNSIFREFGRQKENMNFNSAGDATTNNANGSKNSGNDGNKIDYNVILQNYCFYKPPSNKKLSTANITAKSNEAYSFTRVNDLGSPCCGPQNDLTFTSSATSNDGACGDADDCGDAAAPGYFFNPVAPITSDAFFT